MHKKPVTGWYRESGNNVQYASLKKLTFNVKGIHTYKGENLEMQLFLD
jgi:hypothetical protein